MPGSVRSTGWVLERGRAGPGRRVGWPGGMKDCSCLRSKVPESFFASRGGEGVLGEGRLGGGALLGAWLGTFTDLARVSGFGFGAGAGAVAAADAGRERGLRWTARSVHAIDFLWGPTA